MLLELRPVGRLKPVGNAPLKIVDPTTNKGPGGNPGNYFIPYLILFVLKADHLR